MNKILWISIISWTLALVGCTEKEKQLTIQLLTAQTAEKCEKTLFWTEKCEEDKEINIIDKIILKAINKKLDEISEAKNWNKK